MAIALDVFDVCDREIFLNAIEHPEGFRFLDCRWRNNEEIASRAIQVFPDYNLYTDYNCYNVRNRMEEKLSSTNNPFYYFNI